MSKIYYFFHIIDQIKVVNLTMQSLNVWSLEIKLTVPLIYKKMFFFCQNIKVLKYEPVDWEIPRQF